jgi:hypothetical protein
MRSMSNNPSVLMYEEFIVTSSMYMPTEEGALPKNSFVPTPRITMCWLREFCTTTLRFGAM